MDDNTKSTLKIAAIAIGIPLLYLYLKNSGLLDQWLGAPNEFKDERALLAYCRKCVAEYQNGSQMTAVYVDPNGQKHASTCSMWLAVNPAAAVTETVIDIKPADTQLAAKLREAAMASPILGTDSANLDQWNYLLKEIEPTAQIISNPELVGVVRGVSDIMSAATYAGLRDQYVAKAAVTLPKVIDLADSGGNPYQTGWLN